jgi:hypothetical protein
MLKNVLKLFFASVFLLASCAPVKVKMPSYEGKTFSEVLSGMEDVSEVRTRFSIVFLKEGRERKGEAALDIARGGDMSLRIYSLGFLAMELSSENGHVESSPPLDSRKCLVLTKGLRDCFFWWDMGAHASTETDDHYVLSGNRRTVWVDKRSFLPVAQKILLDDGGEIHIEYNRPAREGDNWFQSRVRIEYGGYSVLLTVSHMSLETGSSSLP